MNSSPLFFFFLLLFFQPTQSHGVPQRFHVQAWIKLQPHRALLILWLLFPQVMAGDTFLWEQPLLWSDISPHWLWLTSSAAVCSAPDLAHKEDAPFLDGGATCKKTNKPHNNNMQLRPAGLRRRIHPQSDGGGLSKYVYFANMCRVLPDAFIIPPASSSYIMAAVLFHTSGAWILL